MMIKPIYESPFIEGDISINNKIRLARSLTWFHSAQEPKKILDHMREIQLESNTIYFLIAHMLECLLKSLLTTEQDFLTEKNYKIIYSKIVKYGHNLKLMMKNIKSFNFEENEKILLEFLDGYYNYFKYPNSKKANKFISVEYYSVGDASEIAYLLFNKIGKAIIKNENKKNFDNELTNEILSEEQIENIIYTGSRGSVSTDWNWKKLLLKSPIENMHFGVKATF